MTESVGVTARAADPRRADQPGRHERAQRPLLHDQGPGAAADPARPVGLLQRRPRRPARAGPGAPGPRLHAVRDREVRRRHPRRRDARGHRAAPHDARAVAGRPPGRDVAHRAGQAHRPRRSPTRTSTTLSALGIVFRTKRGRYEVAVSQLSVGLGLLDLGFPIEAAIAAADVYAEHGRQIAKELNELFRTMVWPVYKESGASAGDAPRGRRAAQAALDRQPGVGVRGRDGRDPSRGDRGPQPAGVRPALGAVPRVEACLTHRPSWSPAPPASSAPAGARPDRAGHTVRAMTRHPETYDGPGEPVVGDVSDPGTLAGAAGGRRRRDLPRALPRRRRLRAQGRRGGAGLRAGGRGAAASGRSSTSAGSARTTTTSRPTCARGARSRGCSARPACR